MVTSGTTHSRVCSGKNLNMERLLLAATAFLIFIAQGESTQHFKVRPMNTSVQEGYNVMIPCVVGNRAGIVQWVKDGFAYVVQNGGAIAGHQRLKLMGDQNAGVYNLSITNASLTDDGEYQCQVGPLVRIKAIRANAHLVVISPPQKVEISSHPNKDVVVVNVGETLRLDCAVRYAKPAATIVWYRGNIQIKGGDTTVIPISIEDDSEVLKPGESKKTLLKYDTQSSITITPTEDDDETNYTCDARHPAIKVGNPMRATVKLSVFYPPGPPYIEGYTEGEIIQRGHQVELICRSRGGNPPAQIVWFRNDETLGTVYRNEGTLSESVLSFTARAEDDKARYKCEVSNVMSISPMNVHVDLTVFFSPTDVEITGPTEAKAEQEVTTVCTTAKSNPPADIKWTVAGVNFNNSTQRSLPAPEGGWITTSNVTFTISKEVRSVVVICHAINSKIAATITDTHIVNVIYPPTNLEIIGYEHDMSIGAGAVLKLTCTAIAGNPPATLTWYKNDRNISNMTRVREQVVTNELEILVNASDNNARVRCEATNSATIKPLSQEVMLRVNFPPAQVKISRSPKEFRAGEVGRIICESSSSNPPAQMSWITQGKELESTRNSTKAGHHGGYVSSVELTLDLNEDMNGDIYTCVAKNLQMDRASLDAMTLNILYKPIFDPLEANELTGMEGEPYVISVSAKANPPEINYTWTRDGLPLSNDYNKRITARSSTLNITKLSRSDAGTYICEATNKEGTTFYQLNLTVQYAAEIKRTSKTDLVYPPDSEAKLFCEIDGSPIGDEFVTWYKVGSGPELASRYSTSFANKTSYLHIENPRQEDVGEYRCNVNNGIGNVTSNPILFITNFAPVMMNLPLTRKAAANKGDSVKLYCKARGSPLPKFTWIFGSKTLPSMSPQKYEIVYNNISKLEAQSTMTIYHVKSNDYGRYTCQAQNKMGQSSDDVHLDVTSPPDQPTDLEVYNVTHDSVTLIWKKGFDGGLNTSHQIRWRQALDNEDRYLYMDISPGDYSAQVTGLKLGTYYVFSIKAINAKGESRFLPDLVKVQTLREAPPTQLPTSEINSSYVIVIIIAVSACACLLIATPIVYATLKSKKKAQRSGPNNEMNLPDVLSERGDSPMNYVYTVVATSIVFFIVNLFILLWYIVRKRNKSRINKSQTADMYAPSTVNGDTMTGELSSVSDEKSDVNFDANDYVDEGRKTAASTYLIDQSIQDFGKGSLEMQVHHQGTLGRRGNHVPTGVMNMDSPPQRTTASGTLSVSKSSYIGNPSPAPPTDVNFYSVEMDSGRFMGYEGNPSPGPMMMEPGPGAYYPSLVGGHVGTLGSHHHHVGPMTAGGGTLTRNRTLPRPVPPPDVTVMTAGTKSPIPPSVPPPPVTFARAGPIPVHSHGHPLSTFTSTPTYSDIDGHLV